MGRPLNFYAGPSVLPVSVLERVRNELLDFEGTGLSLVETSHRAEAYDKVHTEAIVLLRELFAVPATHSILLLGGGATLQFSMIPLNLLKESSRCAFTVTGAWAKKAFTDAKKVGKVEVVFDGESSHYTTLPDQDSLSVNAEAAYCHLTSNETIGGLQWQKWPEIDTVPLVCDMSSDILSRPVPVEKFDLIYAGAQKNLGPSGVTVVIISDSLLTRCRTDLPAYLRYSTHAAKNSLYNTPPVFPIYVMKLVLEKLKEDGGLAGAFQRNKKKAILLYKTIDESRDFYRCPVPKAFRSSMNVVFRLPNENLEKVFVAEAARECMLGLKGHRDVGGCRASLYNAMTYEGVERLVHFMTTFASQH